MNLLCAEPGQREAFAHRHKTAEQSNVVLDDDGRLKLDDESVELARLDAVRASPRTARSFKAGPNGLQVLLLGPRVESDGEMVSDLWSE